MTPIALLAGLLLMVFSLSFQPIASDQIIDLRDQRTLSRPELFEALARERVVLVGETHEDPHHHAVQRELIEALARLRPGQVTVGMEMFHRDQQPLLERWSAGALSEEAFLDQVEWYFTWGFDADLYLPILRVIRDRHLPLVALNLPKTVVSQVRQQGLASLDPAQRAAIPEPAPAPTGYRGLLAEVFDSHPAMARMGEFEHFVEAQQTWDGVMAGAIKRELEVHPERMVVALLGRGHVARGYGTALQLTHQGGPAALLLLPWESDQPLESGAAHIAWGTEPPPPARPPVRLGIDLTEERGRVKAAAVMEHSLANGAGMQAGDHLTHLDGAPLTSRHQLVRLLRTKRWGDRLTLTIERAGQAQHLPIELASPHRH